MRQQRVQDNIYVFDPETGNLSSRRNDLRNRTESFDYDELNRLTKIKFNDVLDREYKYQTNGNIDSISGIGKLSYHNVKVHAVTGFYNTSNIDVSTNQYLDYTAYNKIKSIMQPDETKKLEFLYGADQQRRRTIYTNNGQQKTTWFIGNYEKEQTSSATRELHYINGADGLAAVYIKENGTGALYYILKDHLGSIQYICSETGQELEEHSFDAWGKRRNPVTLAYTNLSFSSCLTRGFTGHEHLDEFSIINMNGRLYDPILGRMLSPDPYTQMPDFTQSLNRYSYCVNNPLKFVDPTGYTWWSNLKKFSKKSFNNLGTWWSDNNLPMIGLNINGDGVLAYAGVPVADGTNVSVGYNFTSDQWGIGNNVGGFSNFYYPEYNYDGLGQNVLREYNGERQAYNDVWRGGASSQGGGKSTFDKINYLAGLKVTGASAYYSAKLNRWSMYRPLESSILSL